MSELAVRRDDESLRTRNTELVGALGGSVSEARAAISMLVPIERATGEANILARSDDRPRTSPVVIPGAFI
jgi:hypothetical protein